MAQTLDISALISLFPWDQTLVIPATSALIGTPPAIRASVPAQIDALRWNIVQSLHLETDGIWEFFQAASRGKGRGHAHQAPLLLTNFKLPDDQACHVDLFYVLAGVVSEFIKRFLYSGCKPSIDFAFTGLFAESRPRKGLRLSTRKRPGEPMHTGRWSACLQVGFPSTLRPSDEPCLLWSNGALLVFHFVQDFGPSAWCDQNSSWSVFFPSQTAVTWSLPTCLSAKLRTNFLLLRPLFEVAVVGCDDFSLQVASTWN